MVKRALFLNLRANMLLLCFVLMFDFRIENNYFVTYTQKVGILNVCVLPSKYNAYVEQL